MKKDSGFTLVEVAFVLIIGGLILASSSTLLLNYMKQVEFSTTKDRLDAIDEALELFLSLNGRYPCPALLTDAANSATFGVENPVGGAACTGTGALAGRGGRAVIYGAVPVRTLNLPDTFITDAWSGRFTYAVTRALAITGTYSRTEGAISVVDNAPAPSNPVALPAGEAYYAVVSHGKNNSGAFTVSGQPMQACNAATQEGENCNFAGGDATFRSSLFRSDVAGANLYDDFVRFKATSAFGFGVPVGAVIAFNLNTCPPGWVGFASAQGRLIAGIDPGDVATFSLGQTGGAKKVALTDEQTGFQPSTIITAPFNPTTKTLLPTAITAVGGTAFVIPRNTTAAAHDNLPPYVTLLYCQKS